MKRKNIILTLVLAMIFALVFGACGAAGLEDLEDLMGQTSGSEGHEGSEGIGGTYTVSFNGRGGTWDGSSSMRITNVEHGATIEAPVSPTSGYGAFDKWYSNYDRTTEFIFGSEGTPVTSNIVLNASWIPTYELGAKGPGGGFIYYRWEPGFAVDGYGNPGDANYFERYRAYYLEAAPANIAPTRTWAPRTSPAYDFVPGLVIGSDDLSFWGAGGGRKSTAIILASVTNPATNAPAAHACNTYGAPNDWYLPNATDLYHLFLFNVGARQGLYPGLITGLGEDGLWYWTSSQHSASNYAYCVSFDNRVTWTGFAGALKDGSNRYIRPVRAF